MRSARHAKIRQFDSIELPDSSLRSRALIGFMGWQVLAIT
jgi:hypothetical protein